ncbi:MAG: YraN family protein [Raoultibacter sp.]
MVTEAVAVIEPAEKEAIEQEIVPAPKKRRRASAKPKPQVNEEAASKPEVEEQEKSTSHNKELGSRGEEAAVRFLERRGFEILERNWTCPAGEADIIAQDGCTLVFVEVKTRSNTDKGLPEEAVNKDKRTRYEHIATSFLRTYDTVDISVRFDVVSILAIAPDRAFLRHHVNAFSVGE